MPVTISDTSAPCDVLQDGAKVGRITRTRGYQLQLDGVFWANGKASRASGATSVTVRTFRAAKALAVTTLGG